MHHLTSSSSIQHPPLANCCLEISPLADCCLTTWDIQQKLDAVFDPWAAELAELETTERSKSLDDISSESLDKSVLINMLKEADNKTTKDNTH
mmetsp:Transcript_34298/g.63065  ORF Transcript_34298/g.63065 Transcript_34298/m.63065 type:complete len:93 (-) Transcript_34298:57-335(-)